MRFITEFELDYPYKLSSPEANKERAKYDMGAIIHEVFDWKELSTRVKDDFIEKKKWSLEIEAFPMDKWIEFKEKLISYLLEYGSLTSDQRVDEMIKELESFGKPVTNNNG